MTVIHVLFGPPKIIVHEWVACRRCYQQIEAGKYHTCEADPELRLWRAALDSIVWAR